MQGKKSARQQKRQNYIDRKVSFKIRQAYCIVLSTQCYCFFSSAKAATPEWVRHRCGSECWTHLHTTAWTHLALPWQHGSNRAFFESIPWLLLLFFCNFESKNLVGQDCLGCIVNEMFELAFKHFTPKMTGMAVYHILR